MISVDVSEVLLFNAGMGIFALLMLIIAFVTTQVNFDNSYEDDSLRRLQVIVMLVIVTDAISWVFDGMGDEITRVLLYVATASSFLLGQMAAVEWFNFSYFRIFNEKVSKRLYRFYIYIPVTLFCILIITTPITGLVFRYSEANVYVRGPLSFVHFVLMGIYLLFASVIALVNSGREVFQAKKKELLAITLFMIPPLSAGIAQVIFFGLNLLWPAVALSILMILFVSSSSTISEDALTELNNKRNLERYLTTYPVNKPLSIIVMDLNYFKNINDEFGHDEGDRALVLFSLLIRKAFISCTAFMSRYGGDEFVVAVPNEDIAEIETLVGKMREEIKQFNETKKLQYELSCSIGYSVAQRNEADRTERCFVEADERMYEDKNKQKQERESI